MPNLSTEAVGLRNLFFGLAISLVCFSTASLPASAQSIQVLYAFGGGSDGANPYGGLTRDPQGNLYGTTEAGGGSCNCGTVFKLTSLNVETILHSFAGGPGDGANPYYGALIRDSSGNLYGTTQLGGTFNLGVVFEVTPAGQETVLHNFAGGKTDGAYPYAGLVMDKSGNLYGTTFAGGAYDVGTIFRLSPSGAITVPHIFAAGNDGASPSSGLAADSQGNAYGTTQAGGQNGFGTVYRIDRTGKYSVFYSFKSDPDGAKPIAGVILDPSGNLYGTTNLGGDGGGTVFKVTPAGEEAVLYGLLNGPVGGLVRDSSGNLYGTDVSVVFKIDTSGNFTELISLDSSTGLEPSGSLILDPVGSLYGTATFGAIGGSGTVFKVVP